MKLFPPAYQFCDDNGDPVASGTVSFYENGTTTLKSIFTDASLQTAATNPQPLSSAGRFNQGDMFGSGIYTAVLKTSAAAQVWARNDFIAHTVFVETLLDDTTSNAFLTTLTATRAETGAVAVSVLNKLRESISVKDFGALGDNSNDDTAEIQAAITALPATGGTVNLPDGIFRVSAELTIAAARDGIRLLGSGGTILRSTSATARIINFDPGAGDKAQNISIENIIFDATVTRTNNEFVRIANCEHVTLRSLRTDAAYIGVSWANCFDVYLDDIYSRNSVDADLKSGGTNIDTYIVNCTGEGTAGNTTKDGLVVESGDSGLYVQNSDFTQGDLGIIIKNSTPANGQPEFLFFGTVLADQANGHCWEIDDGKCVFLDHCWGSSSATGCGIINNGGDFVFITDSQVHNNYEWGMLIQSGAETHIRDSLVGGNGTQAPNSFDGIGVAAGASNFSIRGCRVVDDPLLGSGTQRDGIRVSVGASNNYVIAGNDVRGTGLTDGGTGTTKQVYDNLGHVPTPIGLASNIPIGGVAYGSLGTAVSHVAGTIYVAEIYIPHAKSITGIGILNAGTVGASLGIVALYGADGGVALATSALAGEVSAGANAFQNYAFTAALSIYQPGRYFIAFQANNATDNIRCIAASTYLNWAKSFAGAFGTIGSLTVPTSTTADVGPIGYVY
jgi:polygalacturonase